MNCIQKLMHAARNRERPFFWKDPIRLDDENLARAIDALKQPDDFFTSTKQIKYGVRANWTGADPRIKQFYFHFYRVLRRFNFPVYAHTVFRSPEEQNSLYKAGFSTLPDGAHQRGAAVDVVHSLYHWNLPPEGWRFLGVVGKHVIRQHSLPIHWGGDWQRFPDPAHWQLNDWRELKPVDWQGEVTQVMPDALNRLKEF